MNILDPFIYFMKVLHWSVVIGIGLFNWQQGRVPGRLARDQNTQVSEALNMGSDSCLTSLGIGYFDTYWHCPSFQLY